MRGERRIDADDLRVRLAVGRARIAVEGLALDARRVRCRHAVDLVEQHADGQMERMVAGALEIVEQLLDARLVRDRRVGIGTAGPRFGRILAALAVHVIQRLRLLIVGLERVVTDRPRRRDAVGMNDLAEVALAQPQQHGAVHLAVATDVVMQAGMEHATVGAVPGHRRPAGAGADDDEVVVLALHGIPVARFPAVRRCRDMMNHEPLSPRFA